MSLLRLVTEMVLNQKPFEQGLKSAEKAGAAAANKLSGSLGKIGAAGAFAGVAGIAKMLTDQADRAGDLADQFEMTYAQVEEMDRAASTAGLTFEDLGRATDVLQNKMDEAAAGNTELMDTFESLGISAEEVKAPMRDMIALAVRLNAALNAQGRGARGLRKELFGKAGSRLGAALGEIDLEAAGDAEGNLSKSTEAVDKAQESIKQLWRFVKNVGITEIGTRLRAIGFIAKGLGIIQPKEIATPQIAKGVQTEKIARERAMRAAEVAKLTQETEAVRAKTAEDALSDDERRLKIEREIWELRNRDERNFNQGDALIQAQLNLDLAKKEAELAGMRDKREALTKSGASNAGVMTAQEAGAMAAREMMGRQYRHEIIGQQQLEVLRRHLEVSREFLRRWQGMGANGFFNG